MKKAESEKYKKEFSSYFTEVEHHQEHLYLGDINSKYLISRLKDKIFKLLERPELIIDVLAILRNLREIDDPAIPSALFEFIDKTFEDEYLTDLWPTDAGRVLILDFLDIACEYKRPEDMPRLMQLITWDFFHIPSHILMLIRRHQWHELWDTINGRYNIEEEYDPMIRSQYYLTKEALNNEPTSESKLLHSHQKELIALRQTLRSTTTPVLYVEGKTDRIILNTAYKKLFPGEKMPFMIKECDVVSGVNGGAGGAQTLARLISSVRSDSSHAALALFDNDKEGIDAYNKLPGYFTDIKFRPVKFSKSGRSAAMVIPAPKGREKYADLMNLSIEFLFEDEVLELKNDS